VVCFLALKTDQTQKLTSITMVFAAILDNKDIWLILQPYKFLRALLGVIGVYSRFLCTADFSNVFTELQKKLRQEINMHCLYSPSYHQCHVFKCSAVIVTHLGLLLPFFRDHFRVQLTFLSST